DKPLGDQDLSDAFVLQLQEEYGWTIEGLGGEPFVLGNSAGPAEGMLCYARISLKKSQSDQGSLNNTEVTKPIAIGNFGAEALAARLADDFGTQDKEDVETQLLALDLEPLLAGQTIDLGPKFLEARHNHGFKPVPGESLWVLRPVRIPDATASAQAPAT